MSKKSSSIIWLIVLGIAVVVFGLLCTVTWYFPGSNYKSNSYASQIKLGLDLKGGIYAVYEAKNEGVADFNDKLAKTQDRLTTMLTESGYDPVITVEGGTNLRVEVPDVDNPSAVFKKIGDPCQVVFVVDNEIVMKGKDNLTGASAYYDTQSGGYAVSLEMTASGQGEFGQVTTENNGKSMSIYLVYNEDYENFATTGELVTTATINEPIFGNATITGSFTQEQAEDLATSIESGTFALSLTLIESSTMPATLGDEALSTGLLAAGIGLLLVIAFLIWRYKLLGVVATISLVIYTELMVFFLAALPWVQLTLPGIAGIILSLGMAVDGNVIIYERIKDEYKTGKSLIASYNAGFNKAVVSIVDGNVTTIIAAIILMILGIGTIKGFGLTLLIGIVLSLFTSLILNRFLVKSFINIAPESDKAFALVRAGDVAEVSTKTVDELVEEETEEVEAEEIVEEPVEVEAIEEEVELAEEVEENNQEEGGNE